MSSTAFPNVAFTNPPIVSPNFIPISSVAKERTAANGTMAKKLSMKTVVGSHPILPVKIPSSTNTRGMLT